MSMTSLTRLKEILGSLEQCHCGKESASKAIGGWDCKFPRIFVFEGVDKDLKFLSSFITYMVVT